MNAYSEMYNKTVTVLNKLKATDAFIKQDIWYKTILKNCGWYIKSVTAVSGNTTSIGNVIKIYIPFNDNFLTYKEWKNKPDEKFTISENDVIIFGEVIEDVTPQTLTNIKKSYEPNVCEVRHIEVLEKRAGNGIMLYIEGV